MNIKTIPGLDKYGMDDSGNVYYMKAVSPIAIKSNVFSSRKVIKLKKTKNKNGEDVVKIYRKPYTINELEEKVNEATNS